MNADKCSIIEYQVSTGGKNSNKWIRYKEPFKIDKKAVIYVRSKFLWIKSEEVNRDVFVAENGLIYFGNADKPGESIKELEATYNYKYPTIEEGQAGNTYVGYKIKKGDIKVDGTNLNGETNEITDFKYSPEILQSGKNDIEVQYQNAEEHYISSHLYITATEPELINLYVELKNERVPIDTVLEPSYFIVKGEYEDGSQRDITDFSISVDKLIEGNNSVNISKDNIVKNINISAYNPDTITQGEREPNDDIKNSNLIECNIKYAGKLADEKDVDYYMFTLQDKGSISIDFNHTKMDSDYNYWEVFLLSEKDETLIKLQSSGSEVDTTSNKVRVGAGKYYLKVISNYYSDERYVFKINYKDENDSYETEPNNNLTSQANIVQLNQEYIGNISDDEDVDYYKFSIDKKMKLNIQFKHEKLASEQDLWKISLLGESTTPISEFVSMGNEITKKSLNVRLAPGSYYIKIEGSYYKSNEDYSFTIYAEEEQVNTETEPNDDFKNANEIQLGTEIIGNIQALSDTDYYRFSINQDSDIHLTFKHQIVDDGNVLWMIEIIPENSEQEVLSDTGQNKLRIEGNSPTDINQSYRLKSGVYYVRIEPNYSINDSDYKLLIS